MIIDSFLRKYLLYILVALSFHSCSIYKNRMIGEYHYSPVFEVYYNLKLQKDSSFTFNWQMGLNRGSTKGMWVMNEEGIVLNSEIKDTTMNFLVHEDSIFNNDSIYIRVLDLLHKTIKDIKIELNNGKLYSLNPKGELVIERQTVNTIQIHHNIFVFPLYNVKRSNSNSFEFTLQSNLGTDILFKNTELKKVRNKLIIPPIHSREKPLILKKR